MFENVVNFVCVGLNLTSFSLLNKLFGIMFASAPVSNLNFTDLLDMLITEYQAFLLFLLSIADILSSPVNSVSDESYSRGASLTFFHL